MADRENIYRYRKMDQRNTILAVGGCLIVVGGVAAALLVYGIKRDQARTVERLSSRIHELELQIEKSRRATDGRAADSAPDRPDDPTAGAPDLSGDSPALPDEPSAIEPDTSAADFPVGDLRSSENSGPEPLADALGPANEGENQSSPDVAAIDSETPEQLAARGAVLLNEMKFEVARDMLGTAISVAPDHQRLWFLLGVAHANLGDCVEAVSAYEQALVLDASDAASWLALAVCQALNRQHAKARLSLIEAAALDERSLDLARQSTALSEIADFVARSRAGT